VTQQKSKYRSSFTAGALLQNEFKAIAGLLSSADLDEVLKNETQENKYLRLKKELARSRVVTEMKRRLKFTPIERWRDFDQMTDQEQKVFLFYVLLNAQPLAKDFHFEVVVKRWRMLMTELTKVELQMRLEEIESNDEEVSSWSETTKTKVLTQFIRILTEAGILIKGQVKRPTIENDLFWKKFIKWDATWFLEACLLSPKEIERLK
jgi:hypothetical protein